MNLYNNLIFVFLVFLLTACGGGGSDPAGDGATGNVAPSALAGADQNVLTNTLVTLDGSASSDVNGDLITYQWSVNSKPATSAMSSITNNTTVAPTFTADVDGVYVISLIVNDGQIDSAADTVAITAGAGNVAPVANAGIDQSVSTSSMVTLDASASSDANSDAINYLWSINSVPTGSSVTSLSSVVSVDPTFTPDVDGSYVFSLTVSDGILSSDVDTVTIIANTGNVIPLANAGADANAITGTNVILDGSASSDSDGTISSYNWNVVSVPDGSAVTALNNPTTVNPDFTSDINGAYQFSLVVSDGSDDSLVDTVIITTYPSLSSHVAEIEQLYMSFQGNEAAIYPIAFSIATSIGDVTGNVLGSAYCSPANPYITPVVSSVPPATVYGCDNSLSVTHTISASDASVIFVWTIPALYVDFDGVVPPVDGYAVLTNAVVSVEVLLTAKGNGVFSYGVISATGITYDASSTYVDDPTVQIAINLTDIGTLFSNTVLEHFVSETSAYSASLSDFMLD